MKEILMKVFRVITSRIFFLFLALSAAFMAIWISFYKIQILQKDYYVKVAAENVYEEVKTEGARGNIYDRYGRPLAVNVESCDLYYTPDAETPDLNASIADLLDILDQSGEKISLETEFPIGYNETVGFYYKDGYDAASNEIGHYNFIAELYNSSRDELTEEQKKVTAEQAFDQACNVTFEIPNDFDIARKMQILEVRYAIFCNRFSVTTPVRIMRNISETTQVKILERHTDFVGFNVQTTYAREYPAGELFAHIVGYVGKINEDELKAKTEAGKEYEEDDIIGKTGLELSLEENLKGRCGVSRIELDGDTGQRVSEVTLEPTSSGDNIFLTIDSEMQQMAYDALYQQIKDLLIAKITGVHSKTGDTYSLADLYCALIDNNFISESVFENGDGYFAAEFYSIYQSQAAYQLETLSSLINDQTEFPIASYTEIEKDLYDMMIEQMRDNEYLSYDYQDDEALYPLYAQGAMSPHTFFTECLKKGYLDASSYGLDPKEDPSELINRIVALEIDKMQSGYEFRNRLYHYMIESGLFGERDFMDLLFESGLISDKDGSKEALDNGQITPINCMINKIASDEITPDNFNLDPCSGSVVITDPTNGEVLAMVSYPTYDPNKFMNDSDYFSKIVMDNSGPLVFRATEETRAIGSTYKMCSATAGLLEGVIDKNTIVHDNIEFPYANSVDKPHCWLTVGGHGDVNVVTALDHSCNYFFYNIGYELSEPDKDHKFEDWKGLEKLKLYAEKLGLATKTGIEIQEAEPHASDQDAVRSAIGQGTNAFSCANLNRYTCTIANGGTVYDLFLVDEINSADGKTVYQSSPKVASETGISTEVFDTLIQGMRMMVTDEHAAELSVLDEHGLHTAGKTGTAEERDDRPEHSLYTGFAPLEKPEIVVSVIVPFGGGSANAIPIFRQIMESYYDISIDTP